MTSARPSALFIAPTMPALGGNGLAMRTGVFLEALASVAAVDLLVLPIAGRADPSSELVRGLGIVPMTVPVAGRADTRFTLLSQLPEEARLAAFRAYGRGSRHALLSSAVIDEVRRAAAGRRYDLVHVERLYLLDAGLAAGGKRLSIDLDEDDAWAWRRRAALARQQDERGRGRWFEAEALAEDRLLRTAPAGATLFISSALDRRRVAARHPARKPVVVRNAVGIPRTLRREDDGRTLLFVGSFGYQPNSEGVLWFAEAVWPLLRGNSPAARLLLAGPDMPAAVRDLGKVEGIEPLGRLEDLDEVYAKATLVVAPLRSGGGTRIKLLEAAAHGAPIVATRWAAQGLGLDRRSAWLADDPAEFAAAIVEALGDAAGRKVRAQAAWGIVAKRHDRSRVVAELGCRFAEILQDEAVSEGRGRNG